MRPLRWHYGGHVWRSLRQKKTQHSTTKKLVLAQLFYVEQCKSHNATHCMDQTKNTRYYLMVCYIWTERKITAAVMSFPKKYSLASEENKPLCSVSAFDEPLILTCGFRFQLLPVPCSNKSILMHHTELFCWSLTAEEAGIQPLSSGKKKGCQQPADFIWGETLNAAFTQFQQNWPQKEEKKNIIPTFEFSSTIPLRSLFNQPCSISFFFGCYITAAVC